MRIFCFLVCVCLPIAAQSVRITHIGSSGFIVQSEDGPVVVCDPPGAGLNFLPPAGTANVVTISHAHEDHAGSGTVSGNFTLADGRGITSRTEITAAGITFRMIPGFHDADGLVRNTIIAWTQGGIRFAHFGDYGQTALTAAQAADLDGLDVIFFPGRHEGLTAEKAAEVIRELRPRVAIIHHLRSPLGGLPGSPTLTDLIPALKPIEYKAASVNVSRATLPEPAELWIMHPAANAEVVNSASKIPGGPVAPGSIASIAGRFRGATSCQIEEGALPLILCGVEVLVDGRTAPLSAVSDEYIDFQVPGRLGAPDQVLAEVRVNGETMGRAVVTTWPSAPGLYVVLNPDGQPNSESAPVRRGEGIRILGTGQGAVTPAVEDGETSPDPPTLVSGLAGVFLSDGSGIELKSSVMLPGTVGLWQIDAVIPLTAPTGAEQIVVLKDLVSNALPIQIAP